MFIVLGGKRQRNKWWWTTLMPNEKKKYNTNASKNSIKVNMSESKNKGTFIFFKSNLHKTNYCIADNQRVIKKQWRQRSLIKKIKWMPENSVNASCCMKKRFFTTRTGWAASELALLLPGLLLRLGVDNQPWLTLQRISSDDVGLVLVTLWNTHS